MKKSEFEKIVKAEVVADGAKVVDMNTTFEKDGLFQGTYLSTVLAIRNHVAHRYSAWSDGNGNVTVKYSACLGA